jgi:hypothetical protein
MIRDPIDAPVPTGFPLRMGLTPQRDPPNGSPGARMAHNLAAAYLGESLQPHPDGGVYIPTATVDAWRRGGATCAAAQRQGFLVWRIAGESRESDALVLGKPMADGGHHLHPSVFDRNWRTRMKGAPVPKEPIDAWWEAGMSVPVVFERQQVAEGQGFLPWWALGVVEKTPPPGLDGFWEEMGKLALGACLDAGIAKGQLRVWLVDAAAGDGAALWAPESPFALRIDNRPGPIDLTDALDRVYARRLRAPHCPLRPIHTLDPQPRRLGQGGKKRAFPDVVDRAIEGFSAHIRLQALALWRLATGNVA